MHLPDIARIMINDCDDYLETCRGIVASAMELSVHS